MRNALCVMLSLLAAPVAAQQTTILIRPDTSLNILGRTTCNIPTGNILITYNPNETGLAHNLTLVHELTHASVVVGMGCQLADSLYRNDPVFRFYSELDGYCSEARFQILTGGTPLRGVPMQGIPFAMYMFLTYGRDFGTMDSTNAMIAARCPELAK